MWASQEKYVSEEVGTGLFQYFIKVIPTNYKGQDGASSVWDLALSCLRLCFVYCLSFP